MSMTSVPDNVDDVGLPLEMDCAEAPIVSSGWSPGSPSVSIGSVEPALGCPAVPVGIEPGGEIGLAALDGLGTDCDAGGTVLTVASPVPGANVTAVGVAIGGACVSGSIVKPSAIVTKDCVTVANGLIVEPK
eukprot:1609450-Amphidinium_carterae.1